MFRYTPPYSEFLMLTGNSRAWLDFNFDVGALRSGASAPDMVQLNGTTIFVAAFDGANTLEQVDFVVELNHNWAEGTPLYPHLHWYPTTAGAGNVIWYLEHCLVNSSAPIGGVASLTINTGAIAAGGVAWANKFNDFPSIVTTGYTIGTQAHFRFYRNPTGSDTYGDDAAVATVGLHVLIDTLGSRGISTK